jgi:hypothetical protein
MPMDWSSSGLRHRAKRGDSGFVQRNASKDGLDGECDGEQCAEAGAISQQTLPALIEGEDEKRAGCGKHCGRARANDGNGGAERDEQGCGGAPSPSAESMSTESVAGVSPLQFSKRPGPRRTLRFQMDGKDE